jgi:hypothetical protein
MSRLSQLVATASDIEEESVKIPQWGISVIVRGMDGNRRSQYLTRLIRAREDEDSDALGQLEAELVVACTFDPEDNTQAFSDTDIPMLMTKSGFVIGAVASKAQRLSGLDANAEERLGKDSSTSAPTEPPTVEVTPSVGSTSPSPES